MSETPAKSDFDLAQEIAAERHAALPRARLSAPRQQRTLNADQWLRQQRRLVRRASPEVKEDMIEIGAPEFAAGVIEAMRWRGPECPLCHAQAFASWAYAQFARAAKWIGEDRTVLVAIFTQ